MHVLLSEDEIAINNQNKFNNFENLKVKNQLVKMQSQYQDAKKTIKSQNLELEGLKSQIIELNETKNDSNFLETNTNLDYVITNKRVNLRDLPQIPSKVKYIYGGIVKSSVAVRRVSEVIESVATICFMPIESISSGLALVSYLNNTTGSLFPLEVVPATCT